MDVLLFDVAAVAYVFREREHVSVESCPMGDQHPSSVAVDRHRNKATRTYQQRSVRAVQMQCLALDDGRQPTAPTATANGDTKIIRLWQDLRFNKNIPRIELHESWAT